MLLRVDDVLDHGMNLAVGERVELDDKGVAAVRPRRIILGQQVSHRAEPSAVPHGGDVPAGGDVGTVLEAVQGAAGLDGEGALVPVVANDYLAALERPHLDSAALAVAGVPEVGAQLRVGAQTCGEIGQATIGIVGIEAPHPCRLALVAAGHAAQQLCDVQVVELADEFAVPGAGVVHRAHKQAVDVHVVHPDALGVSGFVTGVHPLDAAPRDQELLKGAAVELIKFVVAAGLSERRGLVIVLLDVL